MTSAVVVRTVAVRLFLMSCRFSWPSRGILSWSRSPGSSSRPRTRRLGDTVRRGDGPCRDRPRARGPLETAARRCLNAHHAIRSGRRARRPRRFAGRCPDLPSAPVGAQGRRVPRGRRPGRLARRVHAHEPRREAPARPRLGHLLQRAARAARGNRAGRGRHRERRRAISSGWCPAPTSRAWRPGQSVEIEYLTSLLTNGSFAPVGPYIVFDDDPGQGPPARATWRCPSSARRSSGGTRASITPQAQFELDAATRDVPVEALPPVFPTPVSVEKREGRLRLAVPPAITAAAGAAGRGRARRRLPASLLRRRSRRRPAPGAVTLAPRDGQGRRAGLARGVRARRRPGGRDPHRRQLAGRRLLRPAVAAQPAAGRSPPGEGRSCPAGPAGRGRPALRLPRLHARRRAQLPAQGRGAAGARPDGALQAQRPPLPPHRRRGLAPRDPEPARAHLGGRAARAHARLEPLPAPGLGLRPRRRPAVRQRLLLARRLRRDPEVRRGAPHRGDPRDRDARPRARRDQGDGGALPGARRRKATRRARAATC